MPAVECAIRIDEQPVITVPLFIHKISLVVLPIIIEYPAVAARLVALELPFIIPIDLLYILDVLGPVLLRPLALSVRP